MDRPRRRPTQPIRRRIPMAMPPPGVTPDTELDLDETPAKPASQRHTHALCRRYQEADGRFFARGPGQFRAGSQNSR